MKTVVITGTDRGLGLALAKQALHQSMRVVLACLDPAGADVRALNSRFPEHSKIVALDVTNSQSVEAAAAFIRSQVPAIDWLVNNAAILGDIEHTVGDAEFEVEDVERVFRVNTVGALRVTHALWDLLTDGGDRLLINVSSEAGSIGQNWRDRWFGYCLSKAALNMQGALLHRRLRGLGGRVMQVHPGYVRTYMHGTLNEQATHTAEEAAALLLASIQRRQQIPPGEQPDFFDLHGHTLPW